MCNKPKYILYWFHGKNVSTQLTVEMPIGCEDHYTSRIPYLTTKTRPFGQNSLSRQKAILTLAVCLFQRQTQPRLINLNQFSWKKLVRLRLSGELGVPICMIPDPTGRGSREYSSLIGWNSANLPCHWLKWSPFHERAGCSGVSQECN